MQSVRIAKRIVTRKKKVKLSAVSHDERARRLYRWVLDNIQPGKEQVGQWVAQVGRRCGAAPGRMSREDAGGLRLGDAPPKGPYLHKKSIFCS